jgi:hypothetical protein
MNAGDERKERKERKVRININESCILFVVYFDNIFFLKY